MRKRQHDRLSRVPETVMLCIAGAMVFAIAFFSNKSTQQRNLARDQVRITREIHDVSGDLLSALKDAETGQRGYLLTGKEGYLEPYKAADAALPGIFDKLKGASISLPEDSQRVQALQPVVAKKMQELAKTIELKRSGSDIAAQALVETDQGRTLMEAIRSAIGYLRDDTDRRTAELTASAKISSDRLSLVSIVGSIILLGFLGLSSATVFRGMARREDLHRQAAENALLLKVTLTSIGDAVFATDSSGLITFINPVAASLTGWKQDEAVGASAADVFRIIDETTRAAVPSPLDKAIKSGTVVGLANHTILLRKGGGEIPIDDSAAPIWSIDGGIIGAVLVFRDITIRRQSERRLAESNEHLKEFVSAVSHDLRSPLHTVNSVAQHLAKQFSTGLGPQGAELLGHLSTGITRMGRLIDDLLTYAQASNFALPEGKSASLNDALRAALQNLQTEIGGTGSTVTFGPLPDVAVREAHLLQLFQNLIGNAIKYRSEKVPHITISAENQSDNCVISVSDNGIGIKPEFSSDIFQPFKRLHGETYPGSGIGLATCQKIVEGYGGRIWVDSLPGRGSIFFFSLPLAGAGMRTAAND